MFSYNYQNHYEIGISQCRRLKFIFLLICFTTKKTAKICFWKVSHLKKPTILCFKKII